jgi:hypothetical protein
MYYRINVPATVPVVARSRRTVERGISGIALMKHEARLGGGLPCEREMGC